jgi:hypothetical protein
MIRPSLEQSRYCSRPLRFSRPLFNQVTAAHRALIKEFHGFLRPDPAEKILPHLGNRVADILCIPIRRPPSISSNIGIMDASSDHAPQSDDMIFRFSPAFKAGSIVTITLAPSGILTLLGRRIIPFAIVVVTVNTIEIQSHLQKIISFSPVEDKPQILVCSGTHPDGQQK